MSPTKEERMSEEKDDRHGKLIGGIILIGIGLIFLLSNWGIIPDFSESWPIVLIVIGVALILVAGRKNEEKKEGPDQKHEVISPPPGQK
jgi:hypothetical protein